MRKIASEYYKNRHGNCGQSVAAAWQKKTSQDNGVVEKLAGFGGGKAPEGLCGALYAIHCIVDRDSAAKLSIKFSKLAGGHTSCRDIRSAKTLSCAQCVEVAAELLDKHLTNC